MGIRLGKPRIRKATFLAVQLGVLIGIATPAAALSGPGGGLVVPPPPRISDVICLTECTGLRTASVGSTIQVTGRDMGKVQKVSFAARGGRTRVSPDSISETSITATVPAEARSGTVRLIAIGGATSDQSRERLDVGPRPSQTNGSARLLDVGATPSKVYLFGAKKPTLSFVLGGLVDPIDLRIDVIDVDSTVVFSTFLRDVRPNQAVRYRWRGRDSAGRPVRTGRYSFRVSTSDGQPLSDPSGRGNGGGSLAFKLLGFVFPLRAPHTYGDGIGAGRGHQGADVLADCGNPIFAARGGRVYWNDYQGSGAGNYVVINLAGTKRESHVYMHLLEPSPARKGSFVKTGERIGTVGSTGRSTACHLHFEHWSSPGWYQGGTFLDPVPRLKAWDRYS